MISVNSRKTCSWSLLRSNLLQQLEFKFEKLLGFRNLQEKLENYLPISSANPIIEVILYRLSPSSWINWVSIVCSCPRAVRSGNELITCFHDFLNKKLRIFSPIFLSWKIKKILIGQKRHFFLSFEHLRKSKQILHNMYLVK